MDCQRGWTSWALWTWLACGSLTAGAEITLNGHKFHVPDSMTIELVAAEPQILRPICADFDLQGRLFVADSSGSNEPVAVQLENKPHRIMCLEDRDQDGTYETSTLFADQMMFPEGVLCHAGSVYVAAPPSIWKLTDTDGDGVADQREEWFQGKTLTGCANDLHGPYLGRDGWIYWCKGAFASQTYEQPGQASLETRASHIFRRHPTTGVIESVMAGGMDNPVEVAFSRGGERFFTTTFFQHPGGGRRDGLVHAIYGGVYGKQHDVLKGHVRTGELMPVLTHLGPAAPCGLLTVESPSLDPTYVGNLLACSFNMHKVTRHVLVPEGATFRTEDSDFVVSENIDFHPTDVLEDADGSMLVIDTGGWYKVCCPTSHFHKPDVLGAVYRVRRVGVKAVDDPWGKQLNWDGIGAKQLAERLIDARPQVRRRAQAQLRTLSEQAVPVLTTMIVAGRSSGDAKVEAVWTLAGIEGEAAREATRVALRDADPLVQQVACQAVGLWRDLKAADALGGLLTSESVQVRRAAAEALGRVGNKASVERLLSAAEGCRDRVLEHSLIYACIELRQAEPLAASLTHADPSRRRAALIAMDQMPGGGLDPRHVAELLEAQEDLVREAAIWIVEQRPEWAPQLADFLAQRLQQLDTEGPQAERWETLLARFGGQPAMQELLASRLADPALAAPTRGLLLRAIGRAQFKAIPAAWHAPLAALLRGNDAALRNATVEAIASWRRQGVEVAELRDALLHVAGNATLDDTVRLKALASIGTVGSISEQLVQFALAQFHEEKPLETRLQAADILSTAKLDSLQLQRLIGALAPLGPMELTRVLAAFQQSKDDAVGTALVAALQPLPATQGVPIATLRAHLGQFGPGVQQSAEKLYAELDVDAAAQARRLDELLATLPPGDVRRGQAIFYGARAACSACHAIGYLGGNIGPDLTRIARIRSPRDLLESVAFPSASFVRSYEPVTVVTTDGLVYNGTIRNEGPEEITFALAADKFVTLPRSSIEEMQPSKTSIMPAGLEKQLTQQELADLVEFLKASK